MTTDKPDLSKAFSYFFGSSAEAGSFVAGKLVPGTGKQIDLFDPATGDPSVSYRDPASTVILEAVESAQDAQRKWWALTHAERGRRMFAAAAEIRANLEPLAVLESISSGKPIRDCLSDADKVAEMFEYYGGYADKIYGSVIPVPSGHLNYTRREALGVVYQMTPWNAPLSTCGWQVAPAVAMGNSIVLKPSEYTPFSSLVVALLVERSGFPTGLVNVLCGYGQTIAAPVIKSSQVKKVVFIGRPGTSSIIAAAAAARSLPSLMELGGKSANIVFADANMDHAVRGAQNAIFAGAGQSCVAGSRLLVERSIYEDFVNRVASGASRIRVGMPLDPTTEVGPINNIRQFDHINNMIATGIAGGAELVCGGSVRDPSKGYFIRPTVMSNVNNQMPIARTEIFGPVVVAIPFGSEEEAIEIANDSDFSLAGAVWTNRSDRAHRIAARVNAGTFWINAYKTIHVSSPFGGMSGSGYGRSSGMEALYEYSQTKSVWIETSATPNIPIGYI